jgi:hypothetical protein
MSPMTHKLLLETLRWDEDTQAFYYLVRRGCRPAGSVAGTTTKEGYRQITLYGHLFSIQRLLFYFKNGYIPTTPVLSGRPRRNTAPRGKLKIKGVTPVRSGAKVRYIAQSKGAIYRLLRNQRRRRVSLSSACCFINLRQ